MVRRVAAYESGLVRTNGRWALLLEVPDPAAARADAVLRAIRCRLRHTRYARGARRAARQSLREGERLGDRGSVGGGVPGSGPETHGHAHGIAVNHGLCL